MIYNPSEPLLPSSALDSTNDSTNDSPLLPSNIIICLDDKVSPAILAAILGYTAPLLYQEAARGVIPVNFIDYSYKEIIHNYVRYFKKAQDVKLAKETHAQEMSRGRKGGISSFTKSDGTDSSLEAAELTIAKLKSDVRLNIAREAQLWQKIAIEKEQYINIEKLLPLLQPFLVTIRDELDSILEDFPEIETRLDKVKEELYQLGVRMLLDSQEDATAYVNHMLTTPLHVADIEVV